MGDPKRELTGSEIAIVGMACRFPGATEIETFWRNLVGGVESLTLLTDDELAQAGVPPELIASSGYVRRASVIDGIEMFDPAFFGYTPLEAKVMDPQHRLFLECAWEVFEQAGYDPEKYPSPVGVFTGAKTNTYLFSLFSNRELFRSLDNFQIALGNDLASMATRVSYKLNLRGPSYALHTACSTALVAVHLACQSLLLDECRMAVAGGAAINVPQRKGYPYQKGGLLSPDGSCRTFDESAAGSNFGNGVGAVLLKRLEDALADGDHIHALILGSATNNDGAQKASYTAPGVEGQTRVLLEAMACSGVEAEDISYIEAHGTATDLGDSIEMLALKEAFGASTDRKGFCAIGSVKTNLGHLETAAGMAGLLKTALSLEHRQLPPSLHFERPNPKLELEDSPFYVNTKLVDWPSDGRPRRAGLSSFGIGSTNCHVILEEPPAPVETTAPPREAQLLVLSARTPTALDAMSANLARHLEEHPDAVLADVAWTLHVGRKGFQHRRAVVARGTAEAVTALRGEDGTQRHTGDRGTADRSTVFLFPGLGDHYVDMGLGLYQSEPVFREVIDRCAELLRPELGADLRELIYPRGTDAQEAVDAGKPDLRRLLGRGADDEASRRLHETRYAQPATFAVEYALARLWMSWGVVPQAMLGYSVGEYVAACLAGVLSLEDALKLVARRARLIQELPGGAMTAVPLSEAEVAPRLARHGLSLAALNGPAVSVASGPEEAVAVFERELAETGVVCRRLPATHAFHSSMMDAAAGPLTELVRSVERKAPAIPYLSNVTGTWIKPEEATDAGYWARHMCGPVRFADGVAVLLREGERIFLEVGPGQGLGSFVRLHPDSDKERGRRVVASMRASHGGRPSADTLLAALGQLWIHGATVDWKAFHAGERRLRVPLPTYPFERSRHWVDPVLEGRGAGLAGRRVTLDKQTDMADWFYRPVWQRADLPAASASSTAAGEGLWLVFRDGSGLGEKVAAELRGVRGRSREVLTVDAGEDFAAGEDGFVIRPGRSEDYVALLGEVMRRGRGLAGVVHLWTVPPLDASGEEGFVRSQDLGFYSLLFLAQALGRQGLRDTVRVEVVSSGVQSVTGGEELCPEKATLLGPCKVVPQEIARVACRSIDVEVPAAGSASEGELAGRIVAEVLAGASDESVAWRGGERWVQGFERARMEAGGKEPARLREQGVYLLTGGLGGLGLALAEHLARTVRARLVLTGRSAFPERAAWERWLAEHPEGDAVSAKIHKLLELESLGAEVLAFAVDVADEARMREVVEAARERFGAIHGVIHLAGTPGGGIIQLKTREAADRIAAPKVRGARVLDTLFRDAELDFLVLFSSIASVLGEFGQVDYCGANAFLDAFAQRNARRGGPPTLAIDWDIWREVGLAVYTEVPAHLRPWRQEMLEKAMLSAEGVEAFDRILRGGLPRTVVSVQELHGRIELGKSFTGESFLAELEKAQGAPARSTASAAGSGEIPREGLEGTIAALWQRVLGVPEVGLQDNFFDIGGNSLLGLQLVSEMSRELGVQIAPVTLFESPTVSALARHLAPEPEASAGPAVELAERRKRLREGSGRSGRPDIAIVGLSGRFPGARNVEDLWRNLRAGLETVTFFTDEELLAAGVAPKVFNDPRYVRAGSILEGIDQFDAGLFGYSPREAEVMDPQHRIFLECCWELFERAGYDPESYPGSIGVFAGSNLSTYLMRLYGDPDVRGSVNMLQAILGNDKDSLTTTVSYKMNLRGPSVAVQTFCSTSLVAVHMACQNLRHGECDMAVAGGIRVVVPDHQGYIYEQGGIAPSDGHSRSFDAKANGSILGHGVGAVLLKRLDDALADGDQIHAVIKGSAINNDGSLKAGYTAPSVAGQADAIAAALDDAGIHPETLSYVEAHGSATELGDPIEVAALTRAWRRFTDKTGICPIGSAKANFGHLDRAAGVTGLIKTVLSLQNGEIPPSINFDEPNPKIDFANSPFYVNASLASWKADGAPRRAAVNSLGMGGTNVHVIVEEAPPVAPSGPSRPWQLLVLSGRSESALDAVTRNLAEHLESHPEVDLADAAFTLQVGRKPLETRRVVVCRDTADAAATLAGGDPRRLLNAWTPEGERPVVFLFSGLGGQYVNMGRGLYESEAVFREEIDRCARELEPLLGLDLRTVIYPPQEPAAEAEADAGGAVDLRKMLRRGSAADDEAARRLDETRFAHPALFALEYALARLWMSWGVQPQALIGYSLGEYVAACLAGVLSLRDALALVADRARRIQELPAGAMLAVSLPEAEVLPLLGEELSPAAVNGPEQTVVAGPVAAVEELERLLGERGVAVRRLQVTHAFHSRMMEPIRDAFAEQARGVTLRPPQIPLLSNFTGTWMTAEEATDPTYWSRHLCGTVRFSEGIAELLRDRRRVLLEIGPGPTLASLVLQHPASRGEDGAETAVLGSLRHSYETQPDPAYLLTSLGKLWLLGARVDWNGFWAGEQRRRVLLPTYPFERQRYWIDTIEGGRAENRSLPAPEGSGWAYAATWKRGVAAGVPRRTQAGGAWLLLADGAGLGDAVAAELRRRGDRAAIVRAGATATRLGADDFVVDPAAPEWAALLDTLGEVPARVVDLWALDGESAAALPPLAREIAERAADAPLRLWTVLDRLHDVTGDEELRPEGAVALAACRQIRRELPEADCRCVDMVVGKVVNGSGERLARHLLGEIEGERPERLVALRGNHRWVPLLEAIPEPAGESAALREGSVWVVAHGLDETGFEFAGFLARSARAGLLFLEPAGFPARDEWEEWLRGDREGVIGRRIARLRQLEEGGARVRVAALDLTDAAALRQAVEEAERELGAVDGVLRVAPRGDSGAGEMRKLAVLDELLRDREGVHGWLVAAEGEAEGALDTEGSLALETFASASGGRWSSIVWALPSSGMGDAGEASRDALLRRLFAAGGGARTIVAPRQLTAGWSRLEEIAGAAPLEKREGVGFYPRPALRVDYVAPRNPVEEYIAAIWKDLLGVAQVGIYDNFLDLGGDSLLATRLVSRMRDVFHLDLPVRLFFERSTVAELAEAVAEMQEQQRKVEDAELLDQVQGLSEDELEMEIMRLEKLLAGGEVTNG
jgi:acyl transferase domain-containing protein/acyl carrier protein